MTELFDLFSIAPYSLTKAAKHALMSEHLSALTQHHYAHCESYRNILDALSFHPDTSSLYTDIPFLPVRLFKELDLLSISRAEVVKTMTSSGTTGQSVSKIFLDRETSTNQMKALTKIVASFIGAKRVPMLIIDTPSVVKDRTMFSARGAGILGFSLFASDKLFALDESMHINFAAVDDFLTKHSGKPLFLFGFTFMVWQHFYKELICSGRRLDLSQGVLIHGGGWKKLASEAVSSKEFRRRLHDVCAIEKVYDYYGMVEQTGTIYMECEEGHLHAPHLSDVIIRRPFDFAPAEFGERGIVEVVSLLPRSYPGHALLTEDEGVLLGEDDCPCGRLGKYFNIIGRLKNAELRGCSDTYATGFHSV